MAAFNAQTGSNGVGVRSVREISWGTKRNPKRFLNASKRLQAATQLI